MIRLSHSQQYQHLFNETSYDFQQGIATSWSENMSITAIFETDDNLRQLNEKAINIIMEIIPPKLTPNQLKCWELCKTDMTTSEIAKVIYNRANNCLTGHILKGNKPHKGKNKFRGLALIVKNTCLKSNEFRLACYDIFYNCDDPGITYLVAQWFDTIEQYYKWLHQPLSPTGISLEDEKFILNILKTKSRYSKELLQYKATTIENIITYYNLMGKV